MFALLPMYPLLSSIARGRQLYRWTRLGWVTRFTNTLPSAVRYCVVCRRLIRIRMAYITNDNIRYTVRQSWRCVSQLMKLMRVARIVESHHRVAPVN